MLTKQRVCAVHAYKLHLCAKLRLCQKQLCGISINIVLSYIDLPNSAWSIEGNLKENKTKEPKAKEDLKMEVARLQEEKQMTMEQLQKMENAKRMQQSDIEEAAKRAAEVGSLYRVLLIQKHQIRNSPFLDNIYSIQYYSACAYFIN